MQIRGDCAQAQLQFSAYEAGVPELARIVESRRLQSVLWQGLEHQHDLELICPDRCGGPLQLRDDAAELTWPAAEPCAPDWWSLPTACIPWARQARDHHRRGELRPDGRGGEFALRADRTTTRPSSGSAVTACSPICRCRGSACPSSGPRPMPMPRNSFPCHPMCSVPASRGRQDALGKTRLLSAPMQFRLRSCARQRVWTRRASH